MRIALLGCGDIGCRLGVKLAEAGHDVHGFRRSPEKIPASIQAHYLDVSLADNFPSLQHFDVIVATLTPGGRSREAYQSVYLQGLQHILDHADLNTLQRFIWVSSTSVYGQDDDSWVDENSPCLPQRDSGQILLEAEQLLTQRCPQSTIVRFSGIYREHSHRYLSQLQQGILGAKLEQDFYTNRIHIADCVGFLAHLLQLQAQGHSLQPCYLASDSAPVRISTLLTWLSAQTGLPLNPELEGPKPMAGSKRCNNALMLASGYQLIYPDYQSGFKPLLRTS